MKRMPLSVGLAAIVLAAAWQAAGVASGRLDRPAPAVSLIKARVAPIDESAWTDAERALVSTYALKGVADNRLRTFLNHPELVKGVMPFANYVATASTLTPRERELLILRTAWLCQGTYVWAHHVVAARQAGLSAGEIARIAQGPAAKGWSPFEATLLRAADELHNSSFVSDPTWRAMSERYDTPHMIDAVFAVAAFTMLALTDNSLRVQLEPGITSRFPDVPHQAVVAQSFSPLSAARIAPLDPREWTPEVRAMLDPTSSGRNVAAVYRTFAQHPKLYPPRQLLSEYIRLHSTLSPRLRELLILRAGWLGRAEYEWAQHVRAGRQAGLDTDRLAAGPDAPGWSESDAAMLRAVDDLYRDNRVSDTTWSALTAHFDTKALMDMLITAGGYRMVSMALNTFGVQLEPNNERFPVLSSR